MTYDLFRKQLIRHSFVITFFITAFVFVYFFIFNKEVGWSFVYPLFVGCRFMIQCFINILLFEYLKRTSKRRNIIRYVMGFVLCFLFFFITAPIEHYLSPVKDIHWSLSGNIPSILWQAIMNNGLVLMFHNILILQYEKTTTEVENSKLKAANLESANLLLKQQIHPHFLFNALSMLKSLYREDVDAGEAYLAHLVNFLRASLADHQAKVARLSDEIKLCNDYIEMQKIRFEKALICTIDIPEEVLSLGSVPSFSVQSLIENAIKHNEVTELSPLRVHVYFKEGWIITENNLQVRRLVDAASGKGLMNLIERYRLFSADEVIINQSKEKFTVSIKVLYNEAGHYRR